MGNNQADKLYQFLGGRLKYLRELKGISQSELAKIVNLGRSSISNIESGKHQAPLHKIYELAIALDYEIHDLLPSVENYSRYNTTSEEDDSYNNVVFALLQKNYLKQNISSKNLQIISNHIKSND